MSVLERTSATDRLFLRGRQFAVRFSGKSTAYPLGYLAALDGTRGLLTLGVLLAHTRMALFEGAMVYMDIFFAMSGYLITSLLLKEYEKRGRISLKKFYARRLMRLYPALTAMVLCVIAAAWFFSPNFRAVRNEALTSEFYLMDYAWLLGIPSEYTGHTWSLAVEEQFYLLWPLLFIALLKIGGVSVRTAIITFALAAAFWGWKIALTYSGASISHLYDAFDCRADALLTGCGLAVLLKAVDVSSYPRLFKLCSRSLPLLALAMIVIGLTMNHQMRWYYIVSPLFGAIPGAISVVGLLDPQRTAMHAIYEHPVPVFLGRICYGCYIWHFPIFVLLSAWAPKGYTYIIVFLIGWPLTFAIATASHYLIERPFMRVRPGF